MIGDRRDIGAVRADGRGHWPLGRRRHPPADGLMARVRRVLRVIEPGRVSRRHLARYAGVSERTARRWVDGEDLPAVKYRAKIRQWLRARE